MAAFGYFSSDEELHVRKRLAKINKLVNFKSLAPTYFVQQLRRHTTNTKNNEIDVRVNIEFRTGVEHGYYETFTILIYFLLFVYTLL